MYVLFPTSFCVPRGSHHQPVLVSRETGVNDLKVYRTLTGLLLLGIPYLIHLTSSISTDGDRPRSGRRPTQSPVPSGPREVRDTVLHSTDEGEGRVRSGLTVPVVTIPLRSSTAVDGPNTKPPKTTGTVDCTTTKKVNPSYHSRLVDGSIDPSLDVFSVLGSPRGSKSRRLGSP